MISHRAKDGQSAEWRKAESRKERPVGGCLPNTARQALPLGFPAFSYAEITRIPDIFSAM